MKVVRWPECDILDSELKIVDEFWMKTSAGAIFAAFIFPISQLDTLKELKQRIEAKKKELGAIEAEIYKVSRRF